MQKATGILIWVIFAASVIQFHLIKVTTNICNSSYFEPFLTSFQISAALLLSLLTFFFFFYLQLGVFNYLTKQTVRKSVILLNDFLIIFTAIPQLIFITYLYIFHISYSLRLYSPFKHNEMNPILQDEESRLQKFKVT